VFRSLLIANRGEIAVRAARTARRLGLRTVAVHSAADRDGPHVRACDEAVRVESYLDIGGILTAPGEAVHPGYGFLAENPAFAEAVLDARRIWVGPPPAVRAATATSCGARSCSTAPALARVVSQRAMTEESPKLRRYVSAGRVHPALKLTIHWMPKRSVRWP